MDVAKLSLTVDARDLGRAERHLRSFGKEGHAAAESAKSMGAQFGKAAAVMSGALATLGAAAWATDGIRKAREYGAALAEVSTLITGVTADQMADIEKTTMAFSKAYGTTATSQVSAYYQAVSAGAAAGAEATALLDSANKLAIGGVTSTFTAVDVLTTAVNAYGKENLSAAEASDALFVAIKAGKTNASELAGSLGAVIPLASSMGVEFEELLAATAALTGQGISTSESITSLKQTLSGILAPTAAAEKAAKKMGIAFNAESLKEKGLAAFLQDVIDKTGGSQEKLAELFGSVEALNGVIALSGEAGIKFGQTLEEMQAKAGATDIAYQQMAGSMDNRLKVVQARFEGLQIGVGKSLLEALVPAMEVAADGAEAFAAAIPVEKISAAAEAFMKWDGLDELAMGLGAIAAAATVAIAPILSLAVAAAAAATYISYNWSDLRDRFPGIVGVIETAAGAVRSTFNNVIDTLAALGPAAGHAVSAVRAVFTGDWEAAWTGARAAVTEFQEWWAALDFSKTGAGQAIGEFFGSFSDAYSESFEPFVENITAAWSKVEPILNNLERIGAALSEIFSKDMPVGEASVFGQIGSFLGTISKYPLDAIGVSLNALASALEWLTSAIADGLEGNFGDVLKEISDGLRDMFSDFEISDLIPFEAGDVVDYLSDLFDFEWANILPEWSWDLIIPQIPDWAKFWQSGGEAAEIAPTGEVVMAQSNDIAALNENIRQAETALSNLEANASTTVGIVATMTSRISMQLQTLVIEFGSSGRDAVLAFSGGVDANKAAAENSVNGVADAVKAKFSGLAGEMRTLGEQAMQGFAAGIKAKAVEAGRAAGEAARAVRDQVKSDLQIQSPSKVMQALGVDTAEGLIKGLEDMLDEVKASGGNLGTTLGESIGVGIQDGLGSVLDTVFSALKSGDLTNLGRDLLGVAQDSFFSGLKSWIGGGSFFGSSAASTSGGILGGNLFGDGPAKGGLMGLGGLLSGAGGAGGLLGGLGAIGSAISAALPIIGGIATAFEFFKTTEKVIDTGLRLTVDGLDTILESYEKTEKSRFMGLSKSTSTSYDRIGGKQAADFQRAVDDMRGGVIEMSEAIGLSTESLEDFYYRVKVSSQGGGSVEDQIAVIGDLMAKSVLESVGGITTSEWATRTVNLWENPLWQLGLVPPGEDPKNAPTDQNGDPYYPNLSQRGLEGMTRTEEYLRTVTKPLVEVMGLIRDGETHLEALERLSSSLTAVNAAMDMLGHTMFDVSIFGADAASQIVDALGGLEKATAAFEAYYAGFYTAQERFDVLVRKATESFAEIGLALPESRAQFRAMVEAVDTSTESGRELYAELIGLAGALDQVLPSVSTFTETISALVGSATGTIGTMISEASAMAREAGRAAREWERAADGLRDFLADLVNAGTSLVSPLERFTANQARFADLISAARGGDVAAARDVPGVARDLLQSAQAAATTAAEYRFIEGRVRAQINTVAGLSEIEEARQTYLEQLYQQQIDVLTGLADYLNSEGVTEDGIADFTGALGGIQSAIEAVEMINLDYLQQRLTVAVDLLADADITPEMQALLRAGADGIQSTLTFAVNESGLSPEMRWLALQTASQHIRTIELLGDDSELAPDLQQIALAQSSTLSRTIRALRSTDWDQQTVQLALAGNSELTRVVNATLASGISQDAMRLALRGLHELAVTVEASLAPGIAPEVRTLALQSAGTYAVAVDATLAADLPDGVRRALLGRQALLAVAISGTLDSSLPPGLQEILLSASTNAVRAITIAGVYADQLTEDQIELLQEDAMTVTRTVVGLLDLERLGATGLTLLEARNLDFLSRVSGRQELAGLTARGLALLDADDESFGRTIRALADTSALQNRGLQLLDGMDRAFIRTVRGRQQIENVNNVGADFLLRDTDNSFIRLLRGRQSIENLNNVGNEFLLRADAASFVRLLRGRQQIENLDATGLELLLRPGGMSFLRLLRGRQAIENLNVAGYEFLLRADGGAFLRTVRGRQAIENLNSAGYEFLLRSDNGWFLRTVEGRQYLQNLTPAGFELLQRDDDWFRRTVDGRQYLGNLNWRGLQLLDATSRNVLRTILATVDDSALDTQQRNFLDLLTADSSGTVTLGGSFTFDPSAAFQTALEAGFSTSVSELQTTLTNIGDLIADQTNLTIEPLNAQLALMQERRVEDRFGGMTYNADARYTSPDGWEGRGAYMANFHDLTQLAQGLGVDIEGQTLNQVRRNVENAARAAGIISPEQMIWLTEGNAQAQATIDAWLQYLSMIPGFATGGMHMGGLRIVGENGPEIEATGPARYYTAAQTSAMMTGRSEDAAMLMELRGLREEQRQLALQVERNTHDTAKILRKWDNTGLPAERSA